MIGVTGGVTKFIANSFRIWDIKACSVKKSDRNLFIMDTCSESIVAIEGAGAVVVLVVDGSAMVKDVAADVLVVLKVVPVNPVLVAAALSVGNKEVRSWVNRSLILEDLFVTEVPEPRAGRCCGYVTVSWSYRTTSAGRAMLLRSTGLGMLIPGVVMGAAVFIFTSVWK